MGNLTNFDPSIQKSKKSALKSAVFLPKCISSKYVSIYSEQWCLMARMLTDAIFEGKLTCAFKNDMKNLANFCAEAKK